MAKLTDIEGIGEVYMGKLQARGITSIEQFLEAGSTKKGRDTLATECGISPDLILKWLNRADLSRIKGISTQYSDLLEIAGVDTVPELAQRRPDNLHAKMKEVNDQKHHVRQLPTESQVADWVAQAKQLPRVIQY